MIIFSEVFRCEAADADLVNFNQSILANKTFFDHVHVDLENFQSLVKIQLWIIQTDMNPGTKSLVKITYSIGGQKENFRVVYQNTEKG